MRWLQLKLRIVAITVKKISTRIFFFSPRFAYLGERIDVASAAYRADRRAATRQRLASAIDQAKHI